MPTPTTEQLISRITWFDFINKLKVIFTRVREENVSTATLLEDVTVIGTTTNLPAVPASFADEGAVQTYLVSLRSAMESRLDVLEGKEDAVITALKVE